MRKGTAWIWAAALVIALAPVVWAAPSARWSWRRAWTPPPRSSRPRRATGIQRALEHLRYLARPRQGSKDHAVAGHVLQDRQSDDVEFTLRQGVKFTNGEESTPRWPSQPGEGGESGQQSSIDGLRPIDRVEVKDKYTIHVITKKPYPVLDTHLCIRGAMVPPKYLQRARQGVLGPDPVGTGPFKFVRWVKDDRIEFEANEQWWHGAPRSRP